MAEDYIQAWVDSFAPTAEILKNPEQEPDWIIRGLLLPTTYMMLFGREGQGKSRILYQLASSINKGESWLGLDVCKRGKVLFLEADMSPEESGAVIRSAAKAGIYAPNTFFPTEYGFLDVLTDNGFEVLKGLNEKFKPLVVIVDTATDVFEAVQETNQLVKNVVRAFRLAFQGAGIVFILHERKKSQFLQAKGMDDSDAHLGPGEWSRKASGSLRLKGLNDTHAKLQIEKTRSVVPFKELRLRRDDYGFFSPDPRISELETLQALALWPDIPGADPSANGSISAVCRDIERLTKKHLTFEALRKAHQRAKKQKVVFPWDK